MAKKARSFKTQKLPMGGEVEGPSHQEGGVEARVDGEPVAEVEGGERLFSQDDTAFIEQSVEQIKGHAESGDAQGADNSALELGYAVAKMVTKQDLRQSQEQEETEAINDFSNAEGF